ncbi:unnamed protein product, partial [Ectocarpus sp. 12 AP-2014]
EFFLQPPPPSAVLSCFHSHFSLSICRSFTLATITTNIFSCFLLSPPSLACLSFWPPPPPPIFRDFHSRFPLPYCLSYLANTTNTTTTTTSISCCPLARSLSSLSCHICHPWCVTPGCHYRSVH